MAKANVGSTESIVSLKYDGEDYQGEMPARELATVLESFSDFTQALTRGGHLEDVAVSPKVKVKALNDGSFEILFELVANAALPTGVVTAIGAGFRFYWKHMRKVVTDYEHIPEREVVKVTLADGQVQEWTERQWRLYNDKKARKAVRGLAAPLASGASAQLTAGSEVVTVPAGDAHLFQVAEDDDSETERFSVWAEPETVSFHPRKKWQLSSGSAGDFGATIEDKKFLEDVDLGRVRIGKNDSFHLALRRVTTKRGDKRAKIEWFVERVIDHHKGSEQGELPEGEEP